MLLLLASARLPASAQVFELTDIDGKTRAASDCSLQAESLTFEFGAEPQELPRTHLVKLRSSGPNPWASPSSSQLPPRPGKHPDEGLYVLDLVDGSRLVAYRFLTQGKTATCQLSDLSETEMPLDRILAVRFVVRGREEIASPPKDWLRLAASVDAKGDRLVVGQPDSLDVYPGIVLEVGVQSVSFSVDGETLPVPRRRVFGLLLHHPDSGKAATALPPTVAALTLWDGSRLLLRRLEQDAEKSLAWTTLGGLSGRTRWTDLEEIVFAGDNAVYLADWTPLRLEQKLLFDRSPAGAASKDDSPADLLRSFREGRIRSKTGTADPAAGHSRFDLLATIPPAAKQRTPPTRPLPDFKASLLDGVSRERSLVLPVGTEVEYALPENFASLRGTAGFDDRVRPYGRARLVIQADRQLLGDLLLDGGEPAREIDFAIPGGARKLTISVDFVPETLDTTPLTLGGLKLVK